MCVFVCYGLAIPEINVYLFIHSSVRLFIHLLTNLLRVHLKCKLMANTAYSLHDGITAGYCLKL